MPVRAVPELDAHVDGGAGLSNREPGFPLWCPIHGAEEGKRMHTTLYVGLG